MLRKQRKLKLKQAVKIGFACLFCVLVNYFLKSPPALNFFSVISVFVLYANFPEEIYQKTFERLIGVVLVSAIAFIAIYFFGQGHLIMYWSIVLATIFISGMMVRYRYGYVFLVGGVAGSIIMLQAIDQTQSQALVLLLMANGQVVLAWFCIMVFEFFFPVYNQSNLVESLRFVRKSHIKYLLSFERYGKDNLSQVRENDFVLLEKYLKQCQKITFGQRRRLRKVASILETLLYEFRILKLAYLKFSKTPLFFRYQKDLEYLFEMLKQQLMLLPDSVFIHNEFKAAYENFARKILADRSSGIYRKHAYEHVMELLAIKNVFGQLVLLFQAGVSRKLLTYAMPVDHSKESYKLLPMTGLRLVFIIAVILVGKYIFHWQGVLQMTIAAVVMSIQPNFGKSIGRMKQRLFGVLLGGAIAICLLGLLHLFPILVLYFCFMLIGLIGLAYLALGDERYSYIGLQAGLLIPLILMGHGIAQGNIYLAWDRLLAVLQGTAIGTVAVFIFAPKFPLRIFRENRETLLSLYIEYFSGVVKHNTQHAREKFSEQFMASMNKVLLEARLNLQDLSHVMRKKSRLKQKIDKLMPIFIVISLNIRVINMLFSEQQSCLRILNHLTPVCEKLIKLLQEANKTWRAESAQSRQRFLTHAKRLECRLRQQLHNISHQKAASRYSMQELEAYGLLLTAFVNIVASMKDYAKVIADEGAV